MSTTARKARKREERHIREVSGGVRVPFRHPRKTGTPVPLRAENQPFPHVNAASRKPVNSVSAAGKRRLAEYEARTAAAGNGTPWPDHRRDSRAA